MTREYNRKDDTTRKAVLSLLHRGLASPTEAAVASGVSKQLVTYWLAGFNWKTARAKRVKEDWQKERNRG